jgi:spore coat-associated protein S
MDHTDPTHEDVTNILRFYPVEAKKVRLISKRGGRIQWIVGTDRGPMILKRESRQPQKALFIAGAHRHLQENGLPIAKLIETHDGSLCLDGGDHSYVLYERRTGEPLNYYHRDHLEQAMAFKAAFHEKSKGYILPRGGKKRRRLGKWEKLYRWKLQELEGFKMLAEKQESDIFSHLFLRHVDHMIARGRQSEAELKRSAFENQVSACFEDGMFCEQDFTLSRLVLVDGEPLMRELRSVNIDLPVRDLRILLDKVMKKLSVWDASLCCDMLRAYDRVRPLDEDAWKTLRTDLRFPHLFASVAQNYYLREKKAWSDDKYLLALKNVLTMETSKEEFLERFDEIFEEIKKTNPA